MSSGEDLAKIFKGNRRLAELNPEIAAEVMANGGLRQNRPPASPEPGRRQTKQKPGKPATPQVSLKAPISGASQNVYFVVPGTPVAKPRQTQRDKWAKRPCVLRYRAWADQAREAMGKVIGIDRLETARVVMVSAYFPMPESWSSKKRAEMRGTPHRQKPDGDNTVKSVCDSLIRKDETVYKKEIYKEWAIEGQERVEVFIVL